MYKTGTSKLQVADSSFVAPATSPSHNEEAIESSGAPLICEIRLYVVKKEGLEFFEFTRESLKFFMYMDNIMRKVS